MKITEKIRQAARVLVFIICLSGSVMISTSCQERSRGEDEAVKNDNPESLAYWASDTIMEINPRLVAVMDSLWQYVRGRYPKNDLDVNIQWMRDYRKLLCDYYTEVHTGGDISEYCMADSVITEAERLWAMDEPISTLEMTVNNDAEYTRMVFRQFNEFDKLQRICKTEEQRELLKAEFAEWMKLEKLFSDYCSNCVRLFYWGGTMSGPTETGLNQDITKVHIELYESEYSMLTDEYVQSIGTFVNPARNLLTECCSQALTEPYYPMEDDKELEELYQQTKSMQGNIAEVMDSWCRARELWVDEVSTDGSRGYFNRQTSGVLIKLAHIASSVL